MQRRSRHQETGYLEDDDAPGASHSSTHRASLVAGVAMAALLVALIFGSQWARLSSLNKRADELTVSIAQAQAENTQLQATRDRAATDAGAEEALRDMGWLKQGETAIVPRPEATGAQGRQPFQPEREGRPLPNWQRWWQWFFGSGADKPAR